MKAAVLRELYRHQVGRALLICWASLPRAVFGVFVLAAAVGLGLLAWRSAPVLGAVRFGSALGAGWALTCRLILRECVAGGYATLELAGVRRATIRGAVVGGASGIMAALLEVALLAGSAEAPTAVVMPGVVIGGALGVLAILASPRLMVLLCSAERIAPRRDAIRLLVETALGAGTTAQAGAVTVAVCVLVLIAGPAWLLVAAGPAIALHCLIVVEAPRVDAGHAPRSRQPGTEVGAAR